jgi:glutamate racemase
VDSRPIGVFDSGIGGLTVVKEIMKILPQENIIYFGDTARVPYGNKSPETITKFALQNTRFLISMGVKAIVIACNTASAFSITQIQEKFNIPVIGVISAGAVAAVRDTTRGKIGIIGTEGTIESRAYEKVIRNLRSNVEIHGRPCPLFVPIVEEGWAETRVSHLVAEEYLKGLKDADIDTLVMGCTHYPLMKEVVGSVMGPEVNLINPAKETAIELREVLQLNCIDNNIENAVYEYYVSDNPEKFARVGNNFLSKEITNIRRIDIEKY